MKVRIALGAFVLSLLMASTYLFTASSAIAVDSQVQDPTEIASMTQVYPFVNAASWLSPAANSCAKQNAIPMDKNGVAIFIGTRFANQTQQLRDNETLQVSIWSGGKPKPIPGLLALPNDVKVSFLNTCQKYYADASGWIDIDRRKVGNYAIYKNLFPLDGGIFLARVVEHQSGRNYFGKIFATRISTTIMGHTSGATCASLWALGSIKNISLLTIHAIEVFGPKGASIPAGVALSGLSLEQAYVDHNAQEIFSAKLDSTQNLTSTLMDRFGKRMTSINIDVSEKSIGSANSVLAIASAAKAIFDAAGDAGDINQICHM